MSDNDYFRDEPSGLGPGLLMAAGLWVLIIGTVALLVWLL